MIGYLIVLNTLLYIMRIKMQNSIILVVLIEQILSYSSVAPTFTATTDIQTANYNLINVPIGGSPISFGTSMITISFAFTHPFSSAPQVGTGIIHLQPATSLSYQQFYIFSTGTATATTFSALIRAASGFWYFNSRYIAVSNTIGCHINVFTNVPIYSGTFSSATSATTSFNYATQASALPYSSFSIPLTNSQVVFFLSCFNYTGSSQTSTVYPPIFQLSYTITSTTTYTVNINVGTSGAYSYIHYTLIIFDRYNVESNGKFVVVHNRFNWTDLGGSLQVEQMYEDSAMMGLTGFQSTSNSFTMIHFQIYFTNLTNATYGLYMSQAVPRNGSIQPLSTYQFTLFYIKIPHCPLDYFYNWTTVMCDSCFSIDGCINCVSSNNCTQCQIGYQISATNLCDIIQCNISQCILCLNVSFCNQCNFTNSYFLNESNGICQFCDISQNMIINMSSEAKECYDCTGLPQCQQNNNNNSNNNNNIVLKKQNCNSFTLTIPISQFDTAQQIQSQFLIVKFITANINVISVAKQSQNIIIRSSYERNILNEKIVFQIENTIATPKKIHTLQVSYSQIFPLVYYSQNQCESANIINKLLSFCAYFSYAVLFVSLFSGKIVGLELFGTLQLSYFVLSEYDFINLYLQSFSKFRILNGFNVQIINQENSHSLPQSLQFMGMFSEFLNNCNVMLLVLYFALFLGLLLYAISRFVPNSPLLSKYSKRMLKQGLLTMIIFNVFNVSFSVGTHFKYANENSKYFLINKLAGIITLIISILSIILMQITIPNGYGQFFNKFKDNTLCRLYIPLLLLYRISLSLYCSVHNQYIYSSLFIVWISLIMLLFIIINLPFDNTLQNYRSVIIYLSNIIILIVTNYYRIMKSYTPLQIKSKLFTAAIIQIIMIVICVVFSAFVAFYQLFKMIRKFINNRVNNMGNNKAIKKLKQQSKINITDEHIIVNTNENQQNIQREQQIMNEPQEQQLHKPIQKEVQHK